MNRSDISWVTLSWPPQLESTETSRKLISRGLNQLSTSRLTEWTFISTEAGTIIFYWMYKTLNLPPNKCHPFSFNGFPYVNAVWVNLDKLLEAAGKQLVEMFVEVQTFVVPMLYGWLKEVRWSRLKSEWQLLLNHSVFIEWNNLPKLLPICYILPIGMKVNTPLELKVCTCTW